jgi:hypothetical protein
VGKRVGQRLDRLEGPGHRLLHRHDEDVGQLLIRDGHSFDAVARLTRDLEMGQLEEPLHVRATTQVRIDDDYFRVLRHLRLP